MIKAEGMVAVFRGKSSHSRASVGWVGGKRVDLADGQYLFDRDVVAFDDEGRALLVGHRGLERADDKPNFVGIREDDDGRAIQIVAADDWVVWRKDERGAWWSCRLCAWALMSNGTILPMESDDDGIVDKVEDAARIRHVSDGPPPEQAVPPPAEIRPPEGLAD